VFSFVEKIITPGALCLLTPSVQWPRGQGSAVQGLAAAPSKAQ